MVEMWPVEYGSLDQEKKALPMDGIISGFPGTRTWNTNLVFISKILWGKDMVVTPFRKSRIVFSACTQSVLSKIFRLPSSNPPASCLDSKVAFLRSMIIDTSYASLTIDNLFFAYFKNAGLLPGRLCVSRTSCSRPNR